MGYFSMPKYFQEMPTVGKELVNVNDENAKEIKAVEADIVLRHAHHGIQGRFFSHAGQRPGHAGRALGVVAHPAAADHYRVHGFFDDFSG